VGERIGGGCGAQRMPTETVHIGVDAHVQGVDSQPFDFPDNFLGIFALTLKFALHYQCVAGSP
jgi:hypothetical protein